MKKKLNKPKKIEKTGSLKLTYRIKPFGDKKYFKHDLNETIYSNTTVDELINCFFNYLENIFGPGYVKESYHYRHRIQDIEKIEELINIDIKPKNKKIEDILLNNGLIKNIKEEILSNDKFFKNVVVSYLNYNSNKKAVKNGD